MARRLHQLHEVLRRRRTLVLLLWVAAIAAGLPFAASQSDQLVGGNSQAPGSGSHRFVLALEQHLPQLGDDMAVVAQPRVGASPAGLTADIRQAVAEHPQLELQPDAGARARRRLARSEPALWRITSSEPANQLIDAAMALRQRLERLERAHALELSLIGQAPLWAAVRESSKEELRQAEAIGLPIVALILLAVFGSVAAAALPLILGAGAVVLTGAVIYHVAQTMEMSIYVTNVASMIGIGVGVDYSLFVLARYRAEIAAGGSPDEAGARALATSGLAVSFSGMAVIVSLATLWLVDVVVLRSIAIGAMVVVAFAVLLATALLPVLISLLGRRAWEPGRVVGRLRRRGPRPAGPNVWERHAARVMRRPALAAGSAAAILVTLATPLLWLDASAGPIRQLPAQEETREAVDRAADQVGGYRSIEVLLRAPQQTEPSILQAAAQRAIRTLHADPEVMRARVRAREDAGLLIEARTVHDPESAQAEAAVVRLRPQVERSAAPPVRAFFGGEAARVMDVSDEIIGGLKWVIPALLLASFLILVVLLRSIVLPLKAVLMNLLAVAAAFGVLVVVFQWQWFGQPFGFHDGDALAALTVPIVLAVCFGLSMDYEVFLLSRVRERFGLHGDNRRAVAEGLAATAGTITAAALIMTSVFLVFVFTGVSSIKEIGLASALAVALDATLVRLVLVPAAMELVGRWNWWLPRPLARALPEVEPARGQEA